MKYYVYLVVDKRVNKIRAEGEKKDCKEFLKALDRKERKNYRLLRV